MVKKKQEGIPQIGVEGIPGAVAEMKETGRSFMEEYNNLTLRIAALEAKTEAEEKKPISPEIRPLERSEFPPEWGERSGWEKIVPRKTGEDIILNGFKIPLVKGEICEVPRNVLPLAVAGGYI
jgi:hypothetical protein